MSYISHYNEYETLDEIIRVGTGVIEGGVLTVNSGDNTKFDISAGWGVHVDLETNEQTRVEWGVCLACTPTYLLTNLISWVAFDVNGNIIQKASAFTSEENRNYIILGVLVHVNKTNLDTTNNQQRPGDHAVNQLHDLMDALGFLNLSGNEFSPYATNLQMKKSVGTLFKTGSNYYNDVHTPHVLTLAALNPLVMQYRLADGNNHTGLAQTTVIPTLYESPVGTTNAVGASNPFTIQRIFVFTSNNVKLQFGQAVYKTMSDAIAAIPTEVFTTEPSILANGLLRGYLIISKDCTDLSDPTLAQFYHVGKFGGSASSGSVGGVTTLQQAYENSAASTQIITDTTGGSVKIQAGVSDTNYILEGVNLAGLSTSTITGAGVLYSTHLDTQGGYEYNPAITPSNIGSIELIGKMTRNVSATGSKAAVGHRIENISAAGTNQQCAGQTITNITADGIAYGLFVWGVQTTTTTGRGVYGVRIYDVSVNSISGSGQNVYGLHIDNLSTTTGTAYGVYVTAGTNYFSGDVQVVGNLITSSAIEGVWGSQTTPGFNFSGSSDGDTGMYANLGGVHISHNNTDVVQFGSNKVNFYKSVGFPSGSSSAPGIFFNSETKTGWYLNTGDSMVLTLGGSVRAEFQPTQNFFYKSLLSTPDNTNDLGSLSWRWDDVYATNGTIITSDERLKKDINDITLGLDFINKLRPVSFVWKDTENTDEETGVTTVKTHTRPHFGLIAQETEAALNECGQTIADNDILCNDFVKNGEGTDRYGMRYTALIAPLIQAVKELTQRITTLEALINSN